MQEPAPPALPDLATSTSDDSGGRTPALDGNQGWWRDAVFYEVFVRSFQDSDADGVGDFTGLTSRLDYLNDGDPATRDDLGIDALWLMPVFASPSYHGYDVTDYRAVNPDYGTLEDFDRFVLEAHQRGIRVILDFVLNHSSGKHPDFQRARSGPDAEGRDRFLWRNNAPSGWARPWDDASLWHRNDDHYFYAIFWDGMPDWNLANPAVEADMLESMRFWLARGVDGFRIDAARFLVETDDGGVADTPGTHAIMQRLRAALSADYPETVLVAESWADLETVASYHGEADEYHLAFGFDTATALKESANVGLCSGLNQTLERAAGAYADRGFEAPFLSNHDMPRVMQTLSGDGARARLAAAALMALPGTPFLYYGEEIGMQGGTSTRDEDKRTPMRWSEAGPGYGFTTAERAWYGSNEAAGVSVEAQRSDPESLWAVYRDLVRVRREHSALSDGDIAQPRVTGGGRGVTAWLRSKGTERVLFVTNLHSEPSEAFTVAVNGAPTLVLGGGVSSPRPEGGQLHFEPMEPQSYAYFRIE